MLQYRQKMAPAPHFQHCHFSPIHCSHNPLRRSGVQSVNFPHCHLPWGTLLCKHRLPQVRSPQTQAQKVLAPAPALGHIHIQSYGTPPTRAEGYQPLQPICWQCLWPFSLEGLYLCGAWPPCRLQILLLQDAWRRLEGLFSTPHHTFYHALHQTIGKNFNYILSNIPCFIYVDIA
jgi:hypothetical protein